MSLESVKRQYIQPFVFIPSTYDEAFKYATLIANSDLAPKAYRNKPAETFLAIQMGAEVGFHPLQSLQAIAVINGMPTIWGDAAIALCYANPACESITEWNEGDIKDKTAIYYCEAKRIGHQSRTYGFSVDDATRAALWNKAGPWQQYPKRMLQMRARGFALRDVFADVLKGLQIAEEIIDLPQDDYQTTSIKNISSVKGTDGLKARLAIVKEKESPTVTEIPEIFDEIIPEDINKITVDDVRGIIEFATNLDDLAMAVDSSNHLTAEERDSIRTLYKEKKKALKAIEQQNYQ